MDMEKKRVLHIVASMNRAGIENALMNYYRHIDRDVLQFDFLMAKSQNSDFDDEIESLEGKIYRIPISEPLKFFGRLNRFFREHKEYDTVHLHYLPWGAATLPVAVICRVKNRIIHIHYAKDNPKLAWLKKAMRGIGKRFSTFYFACGQKAGENYFGQEIVNSNRFKVLKNAIEGRKFDFNLTTRKRIRKKLGIEDNCLLLGQVARLTPVKNHKFSIEIIEALKKGGTDTKCIFLGEGEMLHELKEYAKERNVEQECLFLGSVENPYDYMQGMDLLLFPSINEGLGMVAVEAQCAGLRCLASTGVPRECSLTELVTFLPLADGASSWAEEIIKTRVYERKGRLKEIKEAGYDVEETARELQKFYLSI